MVPNKRTISRLLRVSVLAACWLLTSPASFAHPMGNFSISHYAGIRVEHGFIEIRYLIDMAEIPTFQEIQQNGLVTKPDDNKTRSYVSKQAETLKTGLTLTLNGRPVGLRTHSVEVIFPPGAGGLPTMKMGFLYRATLPEPDHTTRGEECAVYYRDDNFPSRVGWKEVVATAGSGVTIVSTSVSGKDRSSELSNYPTDLLNSPPLDLEASLNLRWDVAAGDQSLEHRDLAVRKTRSPGIEQRAAAAKLPRLDDTGHASQRAGPLTTSPGSALAKTRRGPVPVSTGWVQPNKQGTPQSRFTELMTTPQFGVWFLVAAAAIAAGLGALHALEPGHGKTIVAAYLVGSRGTAYHAFLLGMIVTASHTAGVYALGAVTLYASRYIVPEQLYPWLGAISGFLIAALGSYLFLQRYAGHEIGHSHVPGEHHHHHDRAHIHADGHVHVHDGYEHGHDARDQHGHHHLEISGDVSYRHLLALGITGGIVPCPAALVVLLSAVALNRVAFGLFLIVAFSVGLAAVLIAVGLLMVYARRFITQFRSDGRLITRWLPLTSAGVITVLGIAIAIRSLVTGGILQIRV
jgi:ABC-type nickel/cobalt efflux system permease component RcnA